MHRRRMILHLLWPAACISIWIASFWQWAAISYRRTGTSIEAGFSWGGAYLYREQTSSITPGWNARIGQYSFGPVLGPKWSTIGFDWYSDAPTRGGVVIGHRGYVMIPLYLPTLLSSLPLLRTYQKSRRTRPAFPIEPPAPPLNSEL